NNFGTGWVHFDVDLTTGQVTFSRLCEAEFSTIYYRTETTATGTLVCP
ncbi:MAG: hypothetical protein H6717_10560, partial [Polyangiaceae bacterium]|nr:hypothetical protein [Polyangiaceae bacterium]